MLNVDLKLHSQMIEMHVSLSKSSCIAGCAFVCLLKFTKLKQEENEKKRKLGEVDKEHNKVWRTFKEVFYSRVLILRGLILFFIWATDAFVFYGLSLSSTSLSGNKYVNFILVCLGMNPTLSLTLIP